MLAEDLPAQTQMGSAYQLTEAICRTIYFDASSSHDVSLGDPAVPSNPNS